MVKLCALLLNKDRRDIENQGRVGWDGRRRSLRSVGQRSRDDEAARAAGLNADQPFVPALDDLGSAQRRDLERRAAVVIGAIELFAIALQPASILYHYSAALFGRRTGTNFDIDIFESICQRDRLARRRRRRCGTGRGDARTSESCLLPTHNSGGRRLRVRRRSRASQRRSGGVGVRGARRMNVSGSRGVRVRRRLLACVILLILPVSQADQADEYEGDDAGRDCSLPALSTFQAL